MQLTRVPMVVMFVLDSTMTDKEMNVVLNTNTIPDYCNVWRLSKLLIDIYTIYLYILSTSL